MASGLQNGLLRGPDAPFTGRFIFSVDSIQIGRFMSVSGLSAEIDVQTVNEGGQNQFEHKLPGRMSWPNLVLTRGITYSDSLFEWFERCSGEGFSGNEDKLERTTGVLTLLSSSGWPTRSWSFEGAFPVKWQGPEFKSESTEVATETLEIAHHGFKADTSLLWRL